MVFHRLRGLPRLDINWQARTANQDGHGAANGQPNIHPGTDIVPTGIPSPIHPPLLPEATDELQERHIPFTGSLPTSAPSERFESGSVHTPEDAIPSGSFEDPSEMNRIVMEPSSARSINHSSSRRTSTDPEATSVTESRPEIQTPIASIPDELHGSVASSISPSRFSPSAYSSEEGTTSGTGKQDAQSLPISSHITSRRSPAKRVSQRVVVSASELESPQDTRSLPRDGRGASVILSQTPDNPTTSLVSSRSQKSTPTNSNVAELDGKNLPPTNTSQTTFAAENYASSQDLVPPSRRLSPQPRTRHEAKLGDPVLEENRAVLLDGLQRQPGPFRAQSALHESSTVLSSGVLTENVGDSNKTINGSHVFGNHATVYYLNTSGSSPAVYHARATESFERLPPLLRSRGSVPAISPLQAGPLAEHKDSGTPWGRYVDFLSTCQLGYPFWKPSPRCTDTGEQYTIKIGDVGICSDMNPFHTLFNITDHQMPEDLGPPCDTRGSVAVDTRYHQKDEVLIRPGGAISDQNQHNGEDLRVLTFNLSEKGGALLVLPEGGVLRQLQKTQEFKKRIRDCWRQWYDFAEDQGDLDEGQTLCLLTAVEQCSTWATAAWESIDVYPSQIMGHLKLTVNNTSGLCSWAKFGPPRSSTQSSPMPPRIGDRCKETVFVRGFWINRNDGNIRRSPSHHSDIGGRPESDKRSDDRSDNSHSKTPRSLFNPFRKGSAFDSSSSTRSSQAPRDDEEGPNSDNHSTATSFHSTDDHTAVSGDNIVRLPTNRLNAIVHPSQLINMLSLELASKARPSSMNSGTVAFLHDDDWMSVLEDSDEQLPGRDELLRRICRRFKFVAEGDVVYIESITPEDLTLIRGPPDLPPGLVPVLFIAREPESLRVDQSQRNVHHQVTTSSPSSTSQTPRRSRSARSLIETSVPSPPAHSVSRKLSSKLVPQPDELMRPESEKPPRTLSQLPISLPRFSLSDVKEPEKTPSLRRTPSRSSTRRVTNSWIGSVSGSLFGRNRGPSRPSSRGEFQDPEAGGETSNHD
ncbi:hypothetical protein PQX77_002863 [Marasmius sp. AFHP31]|nr:hypothetical protein PQX77_002863 [Marasmius sp. AFHP31]